MRSVEAISQLTLPPQVESRMQELMRRRSEGRLSASERRELDLIIDAQEALDRIRAKAQTLLGPTLPAPNQPVQTLRNGLPVVQVPAGTPAIDSETVRRFLKEQPF